MDDQRSNFAPSPYPSVPNHIENDPTPRDQAIYVPSVSASFAIEVYKKDFGRDLPYGVDANDLNILDPDNKLFNISHAMTSAGQAVDQKRPCIITERDRKRTLVIGDSCGYQIATNRLRINGDADRLKILRWLEKTADVAITLDTPTGPLLKPDYQFSSFKDCLNTTIEHLDFFSRNRVDGEVTFLNVLHGNNRGETDIWYDAVKHYPFEGWAFASVMRHNMSSLCRRILIMADENKIQNKKWIHVLGTCEIETAVLLTALQRAINIHINDQLRISYDTSSPFRIISKGLVYTMPIFERQRMVMGQRKAPSGYGLVKSPLRFPWSSPLGDKMLLGDFCVDRGVHAGNTLDKLSNIYLAHHNLAALCFGIAAANRIFDAENVDHNHTIGVPAGAAVEAINKIFKVGTMTELWKYDRTFSHLRHGLPPVTSGEDEREF